MRFAKNSMIIIKYSPTYKQYFFLKLKLIVNLYPEVEHITKLFK